MIETKRLILRPFKKEDAHDLYEYLKEESVCQYEPYDPFTYEEAVQSAASRALDPSFIAVYLKAKKKVIGNLYVGEEGPKDVKTKILVMCFIQDINIKAMQLKQHMHLFMIYLSISICTE